MKTEIAEKWISALKSGDFKQAKRRLRVSSNNFCCLGVLCELYRQETGKGRWVYNKTDCYDFIAHESFEDSVLPKQVVKWAGMNSNNGSFMTTYNTTFPHCLSAINDYGKTFSEIAEVIEKRKDEL